MNHETNPYAVLQMTPGAPIEEITLQYRRLAKVFHPDRNQGDEWCGEQFQRIQAAYEALSDPIRKAVYDTPPRTVVRAESRGTTPPSPCHVPVRRLRPASVVPTVVLLVAVALFLIVFSIAQSVTAPQSSLAPLPPVYAERGSVRADLRPDASDAPVLPRHDDVTWDTPPPTDAGTVGRPGGDTTAPDAAGTSPPSGTDAGQDSYHFATP